MTHLPHKTDTADDFKRAYQNCGFRFHPNHGPEKAESKGPCPLYCSPDAGGEDRFWIKQGDSKPLMGCHYGCKYEDLRDAIGMTRAREYQPSTRQTPQAPPETPAPSAPVEEAESDNVHDLKKTPFTPPQGAPRWDYCDASGNLVRATFRLERPKGKRMLQATPDGKGGLVTGKKLASCPVLHSEHFARQRTMNQEQDRPILIVEGEKCVDAAIARKYPATTWSGGCGNVKTADLSALEGRPVILWPDADDLGREAMHAIAERLPKTCKAFWVSPPKDKPKGWDCADADADTFRQLIHDAKPYQDPDEIEFEDLTEGDGEPIKWLWHEYIPEGEITVLAGRGGVGKSTLALTFAAIVASGAKWPGGAAVKKGGVVVMSTEDAVKKVQKPRCQAAIQALGATDPAPINTVTWKRQHSIASALPRLLKKLEAYEHPPALLIIDPLIEIMARGNSNAATDVRESLHPLQTFAARTGMAILGVTHLAKYSSQADAVERVLGSSAWTAKPRMVLLAHHDATSTEPRKLLRTKSNLGPNGGGYQYDLKQDAQDRSTVHFGDPLTGDADSETKPAKGGLSQEEIEEGDSVFDELAELYSKPDAQKPEGAVFPSDAFNKAISWKHSRKMSQYRELKGYVSRRARDPFTGWWWFELAEDD